MATATIFVIDDSQDVRQVLRRLLVNEDFDVVEAADGYEAINLIRSQQPALIFLDLGLPGLRGLDVASHIKSEPALEEIPIIALTAYMAHPMIMAARFAGCSDVIGKPFQLDEIMHSVKQYL